MSCVESRSIVNAFFVRVNIVNEPLKPGLIVVGASARAACYSAFRADLQPFGIDRFGDQDLCQRFPSKRVPDGEYPSGLPALLETAPSWPWIYTGGLENRPRLLRRLGQIRPLLGNSADIVAGVRRPERLFPMLQQAGVRVPRLGGGDPSVRWLLKPRRGSGGIGIRFWEAGRRIPSHRYYLQEFIEGESHSAIFVGADSGAWLVGVTQQLIGLDWTGSRGFHYCGNIGPISLSAPVRNGVQLIGDVLVQEAGLRGVFGVDLILDGKTVWPVEVNPRYTAAVEVLEKARKGAVLKWHVAACAGGKVEFPTIRGNGVAGKVIVYARRPVEMPPFGTMGWLEWAFNGYADLPAPGTVIETNHPIMSVLASGRNVLECMDLLRIHVAEIYQRLERS